MRRLVILAIILRVLVSSLLFHPDIKTYNYQASFLKEGVLNIYSYLADNKTALPFKEEFVYFPLTYLNLGIYQWLVSPILGENFVSWLTNANYTDVVRDPNIFRYLIVLKLPYLILDLLIAYGFYKFLGKKSAIYWLFNPFTIILIYAFSNVDMYAVFLTLVAYYFIEKNMHLKSAFFIGLAAGFKLYPILLLPFLILKVRDFKEKLFVALIPILMLFIVILPFWSSSFVQSALISGLTTRIFNPGFSIGFNESMIVGLMAVTALFFYGWLVGKKVNPFNYWFVILLTIFAFSHFHISWLLWIAPFAVILAVKRPRLSVPIFLLSVVAFTIPFLYEDRSMTVSLFRIYSTWYDLLPTPFSILEKFYDPYNLQSILHSIFAGGSAVLAYKVLKEEK